MKRLTDEELLTRQLQYDDPETIPDLKRDRPNPDLEPEIIGHYDVRPNGGRAANPGAAFVWCCHCQKPTHWDGRVVKDTGGGTYIIGADCGRLHYGDRFVVVSRAFDEQAERQKLLVRWTGMLASRDALLAETERVLRDPAWRSLDLKREEFKKCAPDLAFRLAGFVRRDIPLIIRTRVRDVAAEERRRQSYDRAKARYRALSKADQAQLRREGLAPERDDTPIFRTVEEDLGRVRGRHVVIDDDDVRSWAIRLKERLSLLVPIAELASRRNTDLSRTLVGIREAVEGLRRALKEAGSAWQFFEPDNLRRIERWYAAAHRTPSIRENGIGIRTSFPLSDIVPLERSPYFMPQALEELLSR